MTNFPGSAILTSERKREVHTMKAIRNWIDENTEAVILIATCIAIAAITVVIIVLCKGQTTEQTFDVVRWTVNPANPASPLH